MSGDLSDVPGYLILISLLCLSLAAFFNAVKVAINNVNKGDKLKFLIAKNNKQLALISLKIYIFLTYSISLMFLIYFSHPFAVKLKPIFNNNLLFEIIYWGLMLTILSLIVNIFCETLPKKLVKNNYSGFLNRYIKVISVFMIILRPLAYLIFKINSVVSSLFKSKNFSKSDIKDKAEEDILLMIDKGNKKGAIEGHIKNMVSGIFDFDDTIVCDIMTHRTEMTAIEDSENIDSAINLIIKSGFSRIPVYHEDLDNIIGIIYAKDLLKYVCSEETKNLKLSDITRKVFFIPKTKHLDELFSEMRQSKTQIAIIVDEYGGTEGMVTIEDLIEEILGNIQDEYDNEKPEIKKINSNTFKIDGNMTIDEASELLKVDFPEGEFETISGLIIEKIGHIPKKGERVKVKIGKLTLIALKTQNQRIAEVKVLINK